MKTINKGKSNYTVKLDAEVEARMPASADYQLGSKMNDLLQDAFTFLQNRIDTIIAKAIQNVEYYRQTSTYSNADLDEALYDTAQAAAFLRCSKSTIRNRRLKGELKFYNLGRKVMFKREDLLSTLKPSTEL